MASMLIHLAIAMEYMKNYEIKDKDSFLQGVIDPDLISMQSYEAKLQAHYSDDRNDNMSLKEHFATKTNLLKYLNSNIIDSDYKKGYFLHLVNDYFFFNHFLYKPQYENDKSVFPNLYNDYEKLAKYIRQKYNVDDSNTPWYDRSQDGEPTLFSKNEIDDYIHKCAKIDLTNIAEVILTNRDNWREEIKVSYH